MKGNEEQQIAITNLELELNVFPPLQEITGPFIHLSYQLASQQPVNACWNTKLLILAYSKQYHGV